MTFFSVLGFFGLRAISLLLVVTWFLWRRGRR